MNKVDKLCSFFNFPHLSLQKKLMEFIIYEKIQTKTFVEFPF